MKLRLFLICAVLALVGGVSDLARAAAPKTCAQFCATVRCAYPATCGPYINSAGNPACGCH